MVEYFDINIEKKKLAATAHLVIPSGNVNTYALQLHISGKEWENLSPVVAFYSQEQKYIVMATNSSAVIPTSILKTRGSFSFGVFATQLDSNGNLLYRFSTNLLQGLVIEGAYSARDVCEDKPEDAALYEQLLFQNKAIDKAVKEHIKDETNPHKVTAEQVDAYNKKEADEIAAPMVEHMADKKNPHGVTAKQIGAYTIVETDEKIAGSVSPVQIAVNTLSEKAAAHYADKTNPHGVTAEQVGAYTKTETDDQITEAVAPVESDVTALEGAVAGKLDKVSSFVRVYPGVYATDDTDGTPHLITATSDLSYIGTRSGYIPLYAAGGQLKTATPTSDDSAANKWYVDSETSGKLDKVTESAPIDRVYGVSMAGEQIMLEAHREFNSPGYIPVYNEDGVIKTGTPKKDTDSVNKKYVDERPIQVKDGDIEWGGANRANDYSPVDAAMISELGANRFAFIDQAQVSIEYSKDGGTTWTDYGAAGGLKTACFSGLRESNNFVVGKCSTSNPSTANDKLRITVNQYSKLSCGFRKFALYTSSNGSVDNAVTVVGVRKDNVSVTLAENVPLKGWPGYNIVNLASNAILGTEATQYSKLIFTFTTGGQSASSPNKAGLTVTNIYGFGGAGAAVGWLFPSNMATNGHIYSWNAQQDTTFPARVKSQSVPVSYNDLTNKKYVDSKTAVLTNQYELIETITLTEATNIIERSTKPDGTVYSFAKVLITVDTPKTDTAAQQNIRLYINDGTLDYYAYYQSLTTYAKRAHFDCAVENGLLKIRIGNGATNYGGENTGVAAMIENANIVFLSAINKIKLKGEATFAVGTIIKIYGVRA